MPDLRERFVVWFESQPSARNLIVAGGGQAVEAIRELDAVHRFPSKLTHWLCVDLMSATAKLASELLRLEKLICSEAELRDFLSPTAPVPSVACIQPTAYYTPAIALREHCVLPESWDCTSDSIAAWLASSLDADQLVLLKSVDSDCFDSSRLSSEAILKLASVNTVDPIFPSACKSLSDVRIVNLRLQPCRKL